jgi:hypothetical protein
MAQFSISVERELRKGTGVSVTYTGSRAYDQFRSRDINAPLPPAYALRPDPRYAVVREIDSDARYRSDSMQVSLKGRFAPRLTGSIQYTLSKAMTDTAGVNWIPPNSYDLSLEYARADSDQRHRFDFIGTFTAGRWGNAGAALALYSGRPYSITTGHDDFNTGTASARPAGAAQQPRRSGLRGRRSALVARVLAARGRENGATAVVGIDGFNVLNRVNYSRYIGTLTSPFFGQAIAAQSARRTQLSVRVKF